MGSVVFLFILLMGYALENKKDLDKMRDNIKFWCKYCAPYFTV